MGSRMVVRILSISVALIFFGVFFPSLTNGAVNPTKVDFGEVEVGSQASQLLSISNGNNGAVDVMFFLSYHNENADCGFSLAFGGEVFTFNAENNYVVSLPAQIPANGSINVEVIFAPTDPGTCSATLFVSAGGVASAILTGTGLEAPQVTNIIIDGQDTGVLDFEYDNKLFSVRLDEIAAEARNHGQYVRWVVFWTRRAYRDDKLDKGQMKVIMKAAAHANIPPRKPGLEDLVYNGEPVTDLIEACQENAENSRQYRRCVFDLMKELKKEGVIESRKQKHQIRKYAARLKFHGGHKIK